MGKKDALKDDAHKALAARDLEVVKREGKTRQIEGDHPYNRDQYVGEIKLFLKRSAEDILEAGMRLIVLKEREGHGEFTKIVQDEIGLHPRTAQRFMHAALKAQRFPAIDFSKCDTVSHLYALIEAPDEELKKLEKEGVLAWHTADELDLLSVKEMRDLIRKLKTETDKVVKAEVKGLEAEKKALVKENERLRAVAPDETDLSWSVGATEEIDRALDDIDSLLRRFAFDERIKAHPEIQAKILGIHRRMDARLKAFIEDFDARCEAGE